MVGNPDHQLIDVLAGQPLIQMAAAEQLANRGEVVVDSVTAAALGNQIQITEQRTESQDRDDAELASTGCSPPFSVVDRLTTVVKPTPWPRLETGFLSEPDLRPYIPRAVYDRLQAGLDGYLAELRPAVALFLRFEGIDYDRDQSARTKLDGFIQWVQNELDSQEGTLLQLTVGDKGNYLYADFGAPVSHEDDSERAVSAGMALQTPPSELNFIHSIRIGISRGIMRTGTYGGSNRQTYGAPG